ncbi:MAG: metallopeptidase domain-containing protein [Candidatus Aminicenantales bacterium]
MRKSVFRFAIGLVALMAISLLASAAGPRTQSAGDVALSRARFEGLTRIVLDVNADLAGIGAGQIVVTRPDGAVVPSSKITAVEAAGNSLTVVIAADQFGRITSEGTTIAVKAFGAHKASKAVKVERRGEPAGNGHIIGTSTGLDEGWNINRTDLSYVDPVTGEKGLYSATDVTPNRDDKDKPLDWNDGRILTPAHKSKTMLMLLVEFPDRLAADAEAPYKDTAPYLEYLKGTIEWFARASYGQFRFSLASPQVEKKLGWIMMDKNATDYRGGENTIPMPAYIAEAAQKAYDKWGIKVDDYDQLVIMPPQGKSGLRNGPAYIHRKPTGADEPNMNRVVYVDKDKKPHYISTAITAGNDLFRWGYRWAIHESGHTFGLPDLYSYDPVINGVRIGSFFFCGGWDMMGNIAGHSTDFLGWVKWKLRWLRDDQADVVSKATDQPTTHYLTPVETPGGTKIAVVRTGLSTAYIAEFRTKLGINALDDRGKYSGVLIYRIDATKSSARGNDFTGQVISKKYYNDPKVGGPKNLTGFWRPIENGLDGYDSPDCCWQPGDVFSDPATGVTISVKGITHYNAADPSASPYTADDVATVTVQKTMTAELNKSVVLSNARLKGLTELVFDTNTELQQRIVNDREGRKSVYIREDSRLYPKSLMITKADGSVVPEGKIVKITVNPSNVVVTLAEGAFKNAAEAGKAKVATKAYYHFAPAAAVPVSVAE